MLKQQQNFFETIQMLYNFLSDLVAHDLFIKKQRNGNNCNLKTYPTHTGHVNTRHWWLSGNHCPQYGQHFWISCLYCTEKTEARAVSGLIDEQFVLLLTLFDDLFQVMNFMSGQLQSPSVELSSTMDLMDLVIATLSDKRIEESWEGNSGQSNLCTKADVSQSGTPKRRQAQPPPGVCCRGFNWARTCYIPRCTAHTLFLPSNWQTCGWNEKTFLNRGRRCPNTSLVLSPKHASFLDKKCLQLILWSDRREFDCRVTPG